MPHSCEAVVADFAEKLSARARHVVFLLGAGASCAAGLPSFDGLKSSVGERLTERWRDIYKRIGEGRNLEEVLTQVRLVAEVLSGSNGEVDGLSFQAASALDLEICSAVAATIDGGSPTLLHHELFANWIAASQYSRPIEIFTTNYDLLIEKGLESAGVPYFDGFVGTYSGRFRSDLIDEELAQEDLRLPSRWARVWKLHGSISWAYNSSLHPPAITRLGADRPPRPDVPLAIYPSLKKYEESRREPFVTLADRLRRSLAVPETFAIVCGYSFRDQHINELLYDAARYYPRSEIVALFFGDVAEDVAQKAGSLPNVSALGSETALIGSEVGSWDCEGASGIFVADGKFRLGDFGVLARFLAQRRSTVREPGAPSEISRG